MTLVRALLINLLVLIGQPVIADTADVPDRTPIAGKTANGEDVLLFPNGRWEYVNTVKAAEAKKVADTFPENKVCPPGSQGSSLVLAVVSNLEIKTTTVEVSAGSRRKSGRAACPDVPHGFRTAVPDPGELD